MKLSRFFRMSDFFCLLFFLLVLSGSNFTAKGESNFILSQPRDTIAADTIGSLPFPFRDQPAFGRPSQDSTKLFLNKPSNINFEIEYDPETGQYIFYEKIGRLNYRLPQTMSLDDYVDYDFQKSVQDYWRQRSRIHEMDQRGSLIPKLTVGGEAFNRLFGGNVVNIQPQGYVEVS